MLLTAVAALDHDHGIAASAGASIGAEVRHFSLRSPFVPGIRRQTLVIPHHWRRGGPLLLWLHARGSSAESLLTPSFFAGLERAGRAAPAVVIASDNRFSFWHDRRSRAWARYLIGSVLPRALALSGADPARVAVGGISMGGFGAYNLARLHPGRFCAVGGHSPAIFTGWNQVLPRSFDNRADFARNNLLALAARHPRAFAAPRLWIDVGASDAFAPADRAFAARLRRAGLNLSFHVWPGQHAAGYWHAHVAAYLQFYADALAACGRGR
jgi:S-formylglutathione hydrolase FrmB